jgi:DNA-binding MarR family transcriptional regulator
MSLRVLDLSPVAPPVLATEPVGRRIAFDDIVCDAGMRNVVTTAHPLDIRVHGGSRDFKVPAAGVAVYCISGTTLPANPCDRAREMLRRLAYGFNDYAAREVVARYHRDLKRATAASETDEEARKAKRALSQAALRIKKALRECEQASVGELAEMTGMAQPNVSRTVAALVEAGVLVVTKDARRVICRLASRRGDLAPSRNPGSGTAR